MHHLYPASKGDQLCPLGFHPQVRWPTRCKRCFRDYKEHGSKRNDDTKLGQSSPSLSEVPTAKTTGRSWTSTQNLSSNDNAKDIELRKRPVSWTSTPDLDENKQKLLSSVKPESIVETSVNIKIPQHRRHTTTLDMKELEESFTIRRPPVPPSPTKDSTDEIVILKSDSLAERVRKMNLLKKQNSQERESSRERSVPRKIEKDKTPEPATTPKIYSNTEDFEIKNSKKDSESTVKKKLASSVKKSSSSSSQSTTTKKKDELYKDDVKFLMQIKDSKINSIPKNDDMSSVTTETTQTTVVPAGIHRELKEEIERLREELLATKARAEKAEREKSDLLLRRLASLDTAPNRTAASEALKLQQKVNDLKSQVDDLSNDKKSLVLKLRELENGSMKSLENELKRKLNAAEQLCEELMDENNYVKKELCGVQQEMDEMHDNFRDDQSIEFINIKKELEAQTKNCRILSFKLKKYERKVETLEQEKQSQVTIDLNNKVKRLEDDLKLANELTKRLQAELDQNKNSTSNMKKAPSLGVIGKSTSADSGRYTRASLTRGGSQEDPQQLMRDLQDSLERETDLKEQLKFAEEENKRIRQRRKSIMPKENRGTQTEDTAEIARKKASRMEDENESLMVQLKKMASRARSRKLSPTPPSRRLAPEPIAERDEGISDEDDPAELRVLLELNEQESSVLRLKVEDLENENKEFKNQVKELQEKLSSNATTKKTVLSSKPSPQIEKKIKALEDETSEFRKLITEKDKTIERLEAEIVAKNKKSETSIIEKSFDIKKQLQVVEQEASVLRTKIINLEKDNEKLSVENKKLLMQTARKNSIPTNVNANSSNEEASKLKESLFVVEMERDLIKSKLKCMRLEAENKLPPRTPKNPTEMITRPTLKKWVEELENEISDLRVMLWNSSAEKQNKLEKEKESLEAQLKEVQEKTNGQKIDSSKDNPLSKELELKYKKIEEENKKLTTKIKDLEDKIKKQDYQIDLSKTTSDSQMKREKEKLLNMEKDYDKEKKERLRLEIKIKNVETELSESKKNLDKMRSTLEREIKDLKSKVSSSKPETDSSKQLQDLRKQNEELLNNVAKEMKKITDLNSKYEVLSEENILIKAQLNIEKQNLEKEKNSIKLRQSEMDNLKAEKSELNLKLKNAEKKIKENESKNIKSGAIEYEKERLKNTLADKEMEYNRLKQENEMNIEIIFQLRKENDDFTKKLNDFDRINKVKSTLNEHSSNLENEIKKYKIRLENSELNTKSEVASTRLRYEHQVKNLSSELNSMQRQCERFKKDRDTFKQLLESAQKQITDLKSGRLSRSSKSSGDEDDKSKIISLEQQVGCLEDQLCESRLDVSKYKNHLISERTENEIKISEMQSKLNEYEEDRLIATGRTKIAGMKTKLELSWQKEREDQKRILQETSTLARDLRQTLFEIERERDKERLESKRKIEQLKRSQDEELEEGRKKVSELQCDLLELRDAHAKLRTSNEKLRRERERYDRELSKRRMEPDGERRVGALLQTVDELVKIAPDLKKAAQVESNKANNLQPGQQTNRRSQSPSPSLNHNQISSILARLAETSEELRKFQRQAEEENERNRLKRSNLRRASSTENDGTNSSGTRTLPSGKIVRSSPQNGSLYRKSLSLDQTNQQDQSIWRQDDGSMSSIQSIDSIQGGGLIRDSDLDSRLSGGSTQSDIPRAPRKKKRGLMGKLRSLTKTGRSSETEGSVQGSDSDVSMSSDVRSSKKDLRNRLSGMFKRSGSTSRASSTEGINDLKQRPVAVMVSSDENGPYSPPAIDAIAPKPISRTATGTKPPTPTTPITRRKVVK